MQRLNYPLKNYIKAIEKIANEKGLLRVITKETTGSVIRFELFEKGENVPCCFWIIHHEHNRKKIIWSKDDYRKAATNLNVDLEYLLRTLQNI